MNHIVDILDCDEPWEFTGCIALIAAVKVSITMPTAPDAGTL